MKPHSIKQLFTQYKMLALLIAVALIWAFFSWKTQGSFLTPRNLSNLLRQMSVTGILACGMVLVIIAGEIDLSIGSLLGLLGGIAAVLDVTQHWPLALNLMAVLGCGLVIGLLNGYLTAYRGIPSFIVGLGGMLAYRGILLGITGGITIAPVSEPMVYLGQGYLPAAPGVVLAGKAVPLLAGDREEHPRILQERRVVEVSAVNDLLDFEGAPKAAVIEGNRPAVELAQRKPGTIFQGDQHRGVAGQGPECLILQLAIASGLLRLLHGCLAGTLGHSFTRLFVDLGDVAAVVLLVFRLGLAPWRHSDLVDLFRVNVAYRGSQNPHEVLTRVLGNDLPPRLGPEQFQIRGGVGKNRVVEARVLLNQPGTVACMKIRITQPRRHGNLARIARVGGLRGELLDALPGVVRVASGDPFVGDGQGVHGESRDMPHPHADGGVLLPAVSRNHQRTENLQRFNTLFS